MQILKFGLTKLEVLLILSLLVVTSCGLPSGQKTTSDIEELITHIAKDDGLGTYGDDEVASAVQYGAVEHLLITDKKLREGTDDRRRQIDSVIKNTEKTRGDFHIVSTEHPAGDQLHRLGGIAAILRFRIAQ